MRKAEIFRRKRVDMWEFVLSTLPRGRILPWWARAIRFILFPLETICFSVQKTTGYQPMEDIWIVHGVRVYGKSIRALASSDLNIFVMEREKDYDGKDVMKITPIHDYEKEKKDAERYRKVRKMVAHGGSLILNMSTKNTVRSLSDDAVDSAVDGIPND